MTPYQFDAPHNLSPKQLRTVAIVCFILFAVFAVLLFAENGYAQEAKKPDAKFVTLASAFAAVAVVDVVQTRSAISSGRAHEANPLVAWNAGSTWTMAAVKGGITSGTIYAAWSLRKQGHKTAAWVLLGTITAAQSYAVVSNFRTMRSQR